MRIAYICCDPGIPVFGTKGASIHIQGVVRELCRRGHDVTIHAIRRGEHVPDDLADLRVIEYPIDEADAAARELAQMSVSTRIARALIAQPVDFIYERYSLFSRVIAVVSTMRRIPSVLEVNAPLIDEQRIHRELVHHGEALTALAAQVEAASTTVCVSEEVATWVESHTNSGRITTVPNGVDIHRIQPVGTLGGDTLIIDKGMLKTGICDELSAILLGIRSTGNGKRESYKRKAYTRMTNTFFATGADHLEDMIASIKKGYLLEGYSSGMEDPKNWGIQCEGRKGREIIDGKLTGKIVSPVYLTGYVPDLLESISMVSDGLKLNGVGYCGKGWKELVKTSIGGSYIKARGRLS